MKNYIQDTICAISSPQGIGAIATIRLSGADAIKIFSTLLKDNKLSSFEHKKVYYHKIWHNNDILDDILFTYFKSPYSYTGEDIVEISCHGSLYIQEKIIQTLLEKGARYAEPGEFTLRAFFNGKMDLTQAEAVADLISSHSHASHQLAIKQMRGGFSSEISLLRQQMVEFSSLMELELDFSEEDVEFADRSKFSNLINRIEHRLNELIHSFELGNVIKKGIPVAIVGKPNAGKSTLLNAILNEERAIVSEIPGTTRDTIEDTITIEGFTFRFIDTAGLRESYDEIEIKGIERTYEKINQAAIILYVIDIQNSHWDEIEATIKDFKSHLQKHQEIIVIANKTDALIESPKHLKDLMDIETIFISAKRKENIHLITKTLAKRVHSNEYNNQTIVANVRHMKALKEALKSIQSIKLGIEHQLPTDLLTIDIRQALHHLAEITGEVKTDEILENIFSKFCIGK